MSKHPEQDPSPSRDRQREERRHDASSPSPDQNRQELARRRDNLEDQLRRERARSGPDRDERRIRDLQQEHAAVEQQMARSAADPSRR